jgi:hypothetical protein
MQHDTRDNLSRDNLIGNRNRQNNTGGMIIGTLAVLAVLVALFMWAPWSGPRVADNTTPGTTVGSSTRPVTPPAPVAREPAIPQAPTTTR